MRGTLISILICTLCFESLGQQLSPLYLQGQDNWVHCADFEDGRLVMGGVGDFPSTILDSIRSAMILVSDDLGDNSSRVAVNEEYSNLFSRIWSIEMLSSSTILIAGSYANTLQRVIWRATNSGDTWSEGWLDQNGTSPRWIRDIECFGTECLAVGSSNKILYSSNSGGSWSELSPNVSTEDFYEVVTPDGVNWFISSENEVLHYSNSGGFVTRYDHSIPTTRIALTEQNNLLLTAEDGTIYKSYDDGFNWDSIHVPTGGWMIDAWADDSGEMYAIDDHGDIFYSNDNGLAWYVYPINDWDSYFGDIHVDPVTGHGFICDEDQAYRLEAGIGDWLPIPELIDLPDTLCADNEYQLTVDGDPNWNYTWFVGEQQVATGFSPTIYFDPALGYQSISCEVSYNGQTNYIVFGGYVFISSNYLSLQPYLEEDTVCNEEWTELILTANQGTTIYEVYDNGNLIEGPTEVTNQDEVFSIRLIDHENLQVLATRSNECGSLTTTVEIAYFVDIPLELDDIIGPNSVCSGTEPIISLNTQLGVEYEIDPNYAVSVYLTGDGAQLSATLQQFNGAELYSVEATSNLGCSVELGPFELIEDSVRATFICELNTVPDTIIQLTNYAWGDSFEWILPGSNLESSSVYSPTFHYSTPGFYSARQIATTSNGCIDSTEVHIQVFQQIDSWNGLDTCFVDTFALPVLPQDYGPGAFGFDRISEKIVDASGNTYVVGCRMAQVGMYYNNSLGPNGFIRKYDSDGNLLWEKIETVLGGYGNEYHMSIVLGIELDPHGNIYVCGTHVHREDTDVYMFEESRVEQLGRNLGLDNEVEFSRRYSLGSNHRKWLHNH